MINKLENEHLIAPMVVAVHLSSFLQWLDWEYGQKYLPLGTSDLILCGEKGQSWRVSCR